MSWYRSAVAIATIVAVAGGPLATGFPGRAAAQDTLQDLVGRQQAEVAALPVDELYDERELDDLVAPVALYPDSLLAQVLVASTYPLQIVQANRLLDETEGLSDDEAAARIAEQDWDPSVMVLLSGFPTVVRRMAADLDWTERLGSAMVSQDQDVLAAVQRKRTEAVDTGWLDSNDAQVVERSDDHVSIRPADPNVVYVPNYDPALAFTSSPTAAPYIAPRSNPLANPLVAGAMAFGAALLVQQLFDDGDDDDDRNRGWDDYWRRSQPIDWRDRQFYPRPERGWRREGGGYAWSRERDEHWDRGRRGWHYDAPARAYRERERRAAVAWTSHRTPEGLARIGQLRAVAAEPPERFHRQKPKANKQPSAARSDDRPPARAERPRPKPKPAARADRNPAVARPAPKADKAAKPRPPAQRPAAKAKPEGKSEAKAAAARRDTKPAAARKETRPAEKPAPKPAARKEAKPAAKPTPKAAEAVKSPPRKAAKPAAKPAPKAAAARQEAKSPPRKAARPAAKPAPKAAAARQEAKSPPRKAARPATKPVPKAAAARKEARPAPKPKAQAAQKQRAQKQAKPARKPACKRGENCKRQNR